MSKYELNWRIKTMMTSEHLIENALFAIEDANKEGIRPYDAVTQSKIIQEQAKHIGISMDDVWYIAQYVYYCYKPYVEQKATRELINRHTRLKYERHNDKFNY